LVSPDPDTNHILFSPTASYHRTSRLPSATNNNKTVKPPPYLVHYSRKRPSNTLPPLGPGSPRSRRGRVRTVPSSRANSSKQSRVDPTESSGGQSKRSRSASEEPWDSSTSTTAAGGVSGQQLEIRGSESQIHREASEPYSSPSHHSNRPRRLTKVETVRVLRARSALLLPLPPPPLPPHPSLAGGYPSLSHPSLSSTPLVLKSEDRKKKRR